MISYQHRKDAAHALEEYAKENPLYAKAAKLVARHLLTENAPYGEMCRDPDLCVEKGFCPRDPTCGD